MSLAANCTRPRNRCRALVAGRALRRLAAIEGIHANGLKCNRADGSLSIANRFAIPTSFANFPPPKKKGAYWFRLIVRDAGGMSRKPGWPRKTPGQTHKRERLRRSRSRGLI